MLEQQNYSLNTFKNAHWLVYINGLEVPVIGVSTSFEIWKFPIATIEMVPHPCLQRLGNEDRIQIAIFFLDVFKDPGDPTFRLLGEFEVTGWGYSNSSYGRAIQLNCVSHLQIFAQLFFFYMSNVDDIIVGKGAAFATAAHAGSGAKVYFPSSLFISGLVPKGAAGKPTEGGETKGKGDAAKTTSKKKGPPPEYETEAKRAEPAPGEEIIDESEFIRTPLEFITNIFKALTAYIFTTSPNSNVTENPNRIPSSAVSYMGRNFFGRWILITKFHRRWAALPIFEDDEAREDMGCFPLVKAIGDYHLLRIMQKNVMTGVGQASPVWDLLQMVYGNMYMDVVPIPAPAAVRENKKTWSIERELKESDLDNSGKTKQTFEPALTSFIVKPQSVFGIPPKCNIIFPSMVKSLMFQEDYMNQPTRLYMGETLLTDLLSSPEGKNTGFSSIIADQLATGYPNVVKDRMKEYIQDPGKNTKNFILYAEEFFKGPNTARINAPPWLFLLAQASKKGGGGGGKLGGHIPKFEKWNPGSDLYKRFLKTKEFFETLSAAGTVSPRNGPKIPKIPAGVLWGMCWNESRFNPAAHTPPGGAHGLMQVFPSKTFAVMTEMDNGRFDWDIEFHRLVNIIGNQIPKGDGTTYRDMMMNYYGGKNLKNRSIHNRNLLGTLIKTADLGGFNMILGYLYLQNVILTNFRIYNRTTVNWNDSLAAYSAMGVGKLKREKAKMSVANTAGWLPNKQSRDYATHVKAAWAHFSGAVYGDPGFPKYEDDIDQTDTSTLEIAEQIMNFDDLGKTFDLFAKYEYFRQRYAQRSATVSLVFNPYIVPGFPCVIIDEPQAAISFLGYVTGVSHVMSAASGSPKMTTNVNVSFMRTLGEYLVTGEEEKREAEEKIVEMVKDTGVSATGESHVDSPVSTEDLRDYTGGTSTERPMGQTAEEIIVQGNTVLTKAQFKRYNALMESAGKIIGHPHEPIEGVRDVFQRIDQAEELYTRLFYPGEQQSAKKKKRHLFHLPDFFKIVNKEDETNYLARELLMDLPMFELQKRFEPEAFSYDAAMAYVARPSCSLHNYVRMWHRNDFKEDNKLVVPKELQEQGIKLVKSHPAAQAIGGRSTYYYPRVYKFRPGPVPEALKSKNSEKIKATNAFKKYVREITNIDLTTGAGLDKPKLLGAADKAAGCKHPQTRFDWDEILEQYLGFLKRKIVTGKE